MHYTHLRIIEINGSRVLHYKSVYEHILSLSAFYQEYLLRQIKPATLNFTSKYSILLRSSFPSYLSDMLNEIYIHFLHFPFIIKNTSIILFIKITCIALISLIKRPSLFCYIKNLRFIIIKL